jgi:hypothetical protein
MTCDQLASRALLWAHDRRTFVVFMLWEPSLAKGLVYNLVAKFDGTLWFKS